MAPSKRKGFDPKAASMAVTVKAVKTNQVPAAREIQTNTEASLLSQANGNAGTFKCLKPLRMPGELLNSLRNATAVLGFDIESHDELPNHVKMKSRIGSFRWRTALTEDELDQVRMVQIGWCFDEVNGDVVTKKRLVRPSDFVITPNGMGIHGISHERALEKGIPSEDALRDFMEDVVRVHQRGGLVVAHQLEFDAGVVWRELRLCGFNALAKQWFDIARWNGFCTMNSPAARWLNEASGLEVGPTSLPMLGLKKIVPLLTPTLSILLERHHDAEVDAILTRALYLAMLQCKDVAKMEAYIEAETQKLDNAASRDDATSDDGMTSVV